MFAANVPGGSCAKFEFKRVASYQRNKDPALLGASVDYRP